MNNMKLQACSNRIGVHLEGLTVIAIQLLHMLQLQRNNYYQLQAHLWYNLEKATELMIIKPFRSTPVFVSYLSQQASSKGRSEIIQSQIHLGSKTPFRPLSPTFNLVLTQPIATP